MHDAKKTRGPTVVFGEIDTRGYESHDFRAALLFNDAFGRQWERNDRGRLELKAYPDESNWLVRLPLTRDPKKKKNKKT